MQTLTVVRGIALFFGIFHLTMLVGHTIVLHEYFTHLTVWSWALTTLYFFWFACHPKSATNYAHAPITSLVGFVAVAITAAIFADIDVYVRLQDELGKGVTWGGNFVEHYFPPLELLVLWAVGNKIQEKYRQDFFKSHYAADKWTFLLNLGMIPILIIMMFVLFMHPVTVYQTSVPVRWAEYLAVVTTVGVFLGHYY